MKSTDERLRQRALDDLEYRHRLVELGADARVRAVQAARDAGLSWDDIGGALGMSRQAAHKRFGRAVDDG